MFTVNINNQATVKKNSVYSINDARGKRERERQRERERERERETERERERAVSYTHLTLPTKLIV